MKVRIEYVVGQYMPTEYRKAACAVLASALWAHTRESCVPRDGNANYREVSESSEYRLGGRWFTNTGDWLSAYFRREFGRSIANRWFS